MAHLKNEHIVILWAKFSLKDWLRVYCLIVPTYIGDVSQENINLKSEKLHFN